MKYLLLASVLVLVGCESEAINDSVVMEEPVVYQSVIDDYPEMDPWMELGFGSEGALDNDVLTIDQMLLYAIEDELRAKAEYEMIMATYDVINPFSNIARSEQKHIDLLVPLLAQYDVDYDEADILNHLIEINSLLEAYQVGVIAEIANIAMYDEFLTYDLPEDLVYAFTALRDASYSHLAAFEKGVAKYS
jgi:hypothetical protein